MLYACLLPPRAVEENMNCDFLELPQQQIQAQVFSNFCGFFDYSMIFFNVYVFLLLFFLEEKHFPNTLFKP